MPALSRTTGPCHVYIQPNNGQVVYLGTTERVPELEDNPEYEALMNGLSGTKYPFDTYYQGTFLTISCLFTRYDEVVYNSIRQAPLSSSLGSESMLSRGASMNGRFTFRLVIQNQFYNTVNGNVGDLPGYSFIYAQYMKGTPLFGGTSGNKYGMVFQCNSVYNPQTRGFICYNNDTSISSLQPN